MVNSKGKLVTRTGYSIQNLEPNQVTQSKPCHQNRLLHIFDQLGFFTRLYQPISFFHTLAEGGELKTGKWESPEILETVEI